MRKNLLITAVALLTTFFASAQITDTIVSLTASNKNVVLEEYTGIYCQYCPDGHKIANQLMQANPGRVFVINVHEGGYASNTYTTSFGTALANQTGLAGYPAGTVNRHVFSGSNTALSRGDFASASNTIMGQQSPVNIAADGVLDWETRTVTIRVQLYYTGSQSVSSNALNIAIIQDNVLGSQTGGSTWNPAQMVGNQYNHMHMLRHLITGQWGETIETIAPGTLVEKTYTYEIPAQLGTPNPIDAVLSDLHFIAFVAEGHQEILTGTEVEITNQYPEFGVAMRNLKEEAPGVQNCNAEYATYFELQNIGMTDFSSIEYQYTINDVTETVTRNISIASGVTDSIQMPAFPINLGSNNTVKIKVLKINDNEVDCPERTLTVKKTVATAGGYMYFKITQDKYGTETTFKFFAPDGTVALSGGPFTTLSGNSGTAMHEYDFKPTQTGCYRLEVYDEYGDGINAGYGAGGFELWDAQDNKLIVDNGKFGSQATYYIEVSAPYALDDEEITNTVVYPNPATDNITINASEDVNRVEVYNMQGQLVKAENGNSTISVKELSNGMYMLKVITANGTSMHKIVKK